MHCSSVQGKLQSPLQCCSTKEAQSRQCVTAVSCGGLLFTQGAVTQHKCTAAMSKANRNPHISVMLCKRGSQQAVCHCSYTCEDLLFTQGAVTQHKCTAALSKAKCNPNSMFVPLQFTCENLPFIQVCSDSTSMHCRTGQGRIASLLFSAALQKHLTACLCHCNSPMEICPSYRCAVMQHQCIAELVKAE